MKEMVDGQSGEWKELVEGSNDGIDLVFFLVFLFFFLKKRGGLKPFDICIKQKNGQVSYFLILNHSIEMSSDLIDIRSSQKTL